ncbi:hypothetical protein ACYSUO_18375 [Streptomyces sp. UC4497]
MRSVGVVSGLDDDVVREGEGDGLLLRFFESDSGFLLVGVGDGVIVRECEGEGGADVGSVGDGDAERVVGVDERDGASVIAVAVAAVLSEAEASSSPGDVISTVTRVATLSTAVTAESSSIRPCLAGSSGSGPSSASSPAACGGGGGYAYGSAARGGVGCEGSESET